MAATENLLGHDSEPSDNEADQPGPSKKARLGAATYKIKLNKAWIEDYPFICEVARNPHSFFCKTCNRQMSCSNMGKHDVARHASTAKHKENAKASRSQSTLSFPSFSSTLVDKVRRDNIVTYLFIMAFVYR